MEHCYLRETRFPKLGKGPWYACVCMYVCLYVSCMHALFYGWHFLLSGCLWWRGERLPIHPAHWCMIGTSMLCTILMFRLILIVGETAPAACPACITLDMYSGPAWPTRVHIHTHLLHIYAALHMQMMRTLACTHTQTHKHTHKHAHAQPTHTYTHTRYTCTCSCKCTGAHTIIQEQVIQSPCRTTARNPFAGDT